MKHSKRRPAPSVRSPQTPAFSPHLIAALALALLTLLAYSNSFHGGFILDNKGLILNDPRLREANAENLRLILKHTYWWPTGEGGVYRPFTTLTYLFNYAILGNRDQPAGYHAINFLIHLCNVLMVYALTRRFLRSFWPCVLIAAAWAIHPVQTEAVTNIVGRADLLAATGLLGGFLAYLRATEARGSKRLLWLAAVAAFSAVGICSKENAIVLPGVILLYEMTFRRDRTRAWPQLAALTAALLPIGIWFWQRSVVLANSLPKEVPFTDNPILGADFLAGRATALKVLCDYLLLALWPARLSPDYSFSQIPISRGSLTDWISLLAILALVPALALLYRRNRGAFFLALIAIAWMAPVANLIFPIGTIMAERFLYIPLLGIVPCIVLGVFAAADRAGRPAYAFAIVGAILAALTLRTWLRNNDWNNELAMATASVRTSPGNYKTHDLLANVLFASDPTHTNIARVIEESEKTQAILAPLPDHRNVPDPWEFAGTCYLITGNYPKAIAALHRFLAVEKAEFAEFRRSVKPGGPSAESAESVTARRQGDAWTMLSLAYLKSGDPAGAADAMDRARTLNPLSPQIYKQMSAVDLALGKADEAAVVLVEGAFITSDHSLRQDLVELYQRTMKPGSCALVPGPRGLALNPACPIVHAHLCAAEAGVVKTLTDTDQASLAQTRRQTFVEEFGCRQ